MYKYLVRLFRSPSISILAEDELCSIILNKLFHQHRAWKCWHQLWNWSETRYLVLEPRINFHRSVFPYWCVLTDNATAWVSWNPKLSKWNTTLLLITFRNFSSNNSCPANHFSWMNNCRTKRKMGSHLFWLF